MSDPQKENRNSKGMKRRLGTASVFAICTGAMFSSGFFLLPGLAAEESGPSLPLVYLLASLFILPAIFSMAELSAAIPRAGGPYLFLKRSLGTLTGIIGAFGKYLQLLLKGAFAFVGVGAYLKLLLDVSIEPVAIVLIVAFTILNLLGVKQTARTEVILVSILLLLLAYFVTSGFIQFHTEDLTVTKHFQPLLPYGIKGLFAGIALVFVSYGGVGQIASLAEEIRKPERSIPRGMLIALATATVFYLLGTTIMVVLLNPDALHSDQAPVATTARQFSELPLPTWVVVVAALAAFASTGNAAIMSAARYPLALARDKVIWKKFGHLDSKGVPKVAVMTTGILLVLLVLIFDVKGIAKLASAFLLFVFVGMCLAVIIFRESRIDEYRPAYKSPFYPWTQLIGIISYIALIIESGLEAIGLMVGLCLLCLLLYRFGIQRKIANTAAVYNLFSRLAAKKFSHQLNSETGLPVSGGMNLSLLAERAIVLDQEEEISLNEVVQLAADQLSSQLGGDRKELARHLQAELKHWRKPLRSQIVVSPVLLHGIEQPEMVIIRGKIRLDGHAANGLIVLADDEEDSDRLMKLLSRLEAVIFHSGFTADWQNAENPKELKEALKRDVESIQNLTISIENKGPAASLKGKAVADVNLPEGSLIVLILRDGKAFVPQGTTEIRYGDEITLLAQAEAMETLKDRFTHIKD